MKKINLVTKVKVLPVGELNGYENNPRKIDAVAIDTVANSIREFGFKVPLIIDKDNVIVAGHTRLAAAKKLGMKEVPCIVADDLTAEQAKAFRLVDNKTSELSVWDFEKLEDEIRALTDITLEDFGFSMELDSLNSGEGSKNDENRDGSNEVDLEEFAAERFQRICPRCGFHFNDK